MSTGRTFAEVPFCCFTHPTAASLDLICLMNATTLGLWWRLLSLPDPFLQWVSGFDSTRNCGSKLLSYLTIWSLPSPINPTLFQQTRKNKTNHLRSCHGLRWQKLHLGHLISKSGENWFKIATHTVHSVRHAAHTSTTTIADCCQVL